MTLRTYDRMAGILILIGLLFSATVAATSWKWFPSEGDWGHIADIPPNALNYVALLLPWCLVLSYLLIRRLFFEKR